MEEKLKKVIFKYTNVQVENEQNLLDIFDCTEYWLYIVWELENVYFIPFIRVIEEISCENFTVQKICEKLNAICIEKQK